MDLKLLQQQSDVEWRIPPHGAMRVPGILYGSVELIRQMDAKVYEQVSNVASLPGIVKASFAMPDAHWGYGFPIGGVAAFDADEDGVVSAGGVGFDVSCGIRTLHTGLSAEQVFAAREELADALFKGVPAGVGSTGKISLNRKAMHDMLGGGARWAVEQGYGREGDLDRIEEGGCATGAQPQAVSDKAKERQQDEMGTLGSGNHYLEIQRVAEVFQKDIARGYGLNVGDAVLSIHCGSRGLGHQVGTDYLKEMVEAAADYGLRLVDRELACAPIHSPLGQRYLGAMRSAINCALANRQIITHLAREAFAKVLPRADLRLLYDVSHNACKVEEHDVDGRTRELFVHRKGATRAYGPGNPAIAPSLRAWGQPVLIGGTMGTASYILAGTQQSLGQAFGSSCHGAGRNMSRTQATKQWHGREVIEQLAQQGILIRAVSARGVAEEAPGAYKDVSAVVDAAQAAGLSCKVARLTPMICIKG